MNADEFFKFAAAAVICGTIILVVLIGLIAIPIGAAILGGFKVYLVYKHSPAVMERRERARTHELYNDVRTRVPPPMSKEDFGRGVYRQLPVEGKPEHVRGLVIETILDLYDMEEHLVDELPSPPPICNSIEGAKYRDFLSAYAAKAHSPHATEEAARRIAESLSTYLRCVPDDEGTAFATVPLTYMLRDKAEAITETIRPFYGNDDLFGSLREQIDRNVCDVSEVAYPPRGERLVLPVDYKGDNIQFAYLKDTPLLRLFDARVPLAIPDSIRTEHHWIVAGSGHGKTQTLQYMIARDLELVAEGKASVVVMTSQAGKGKEKGLIDNIAGLKCFTEIPLLWIDPADAEYPMAVNLFDANLDRLKTYSLADRERILNSTIDVYSFVMRALLDAPMTSRQETVFQFTARLMFEIPDATLHTFLKLMDKKLDPTFLQHIQKLDPTAQEFFKDFNEGKYEDTKAQVRGRLFGILRYSTFDRMFSSPRNKIDFFTELQTPKAVLINTAQSHLQRMGSSLFGRFMIALLARAAEERATEENPLPTYLYIDEATDYFDEQFPPMLAQVRKRNIGVILAHQDLDQVRKVPGLLGSLGANTSIRFAGGTSVSDAKALAPDLHTIPEFISGQQKGTFAAFVRGVTPQAVPLSFAFGHMEQMERMTQEEQDALRNLMRERYGAEMRLAKKPMDEEPPDDPLEEDPNLVDV